jgi:hypothetical protein
LAGSGVANPFADGDLSGPAEPMLISELSLTLGIPDDYLEFLALHNGGEGFVGDNYLVLWAAEDLVTYNREYEVDTYAPGVFLFGSDGGGEAYGYDTLSDPKSIVRLPFIGMDRSNIEVVANRFSDFLNVLVSR